jgi:hypothetical protein
MLKIIILSLLIIILQFFLSKQENKWLGLILPFISLIIATLPIIAYLLSIISGGISEQGNFSELGFGFITANIPTLILLGIYFFYRNHLKKNNELEKMSIKDL